MITEEMARKYFPNAHIRKNRKGWKVWLPGGAQASIERQGEISDFVGGAEIYVPSILLVNESNHGNGVVAWGGGHNHLLASVAYGEMLDTTVIPEVRDDINGPIVAMVALSSLMALMLWFFLGPVVAVLFWIIFGGTGIATLMHDDREEARQKGQAYRNVMPPVHGTNRQTTREQARKLL